MQLFLGTGLATDTRGRGALDGPGGAPRATRRPALIGTGRIGTQLVVDPGAWTGAQRFGFAWLRNGVPVAGAQGLAYAPDAADDRAALACRVTATGATGAKAATAIATTAAITIAFPPPSPVGPISDLLYTQFPGSHVVNISPFFSGGSLEFSVTGAGVAVDPATGVVTLDVAALAAGGTVTVAAANSGGRVELDLTLRLATPPVAIAPPTLSGPAVIGAPIAVEPGVWAGQPAPDLALQWLADGAPIAGAAEAAFTPGAVHDGAALACRVTATNVAGTAMVETAAIAAAFAPPTTVGTLADRAFARGTGPQVVPAAAAFDGGGLVFAVEGAGAGVDAATGVVTIPTEAARAAAPVVVTATNSGGSVRLGFAVSVLAAPAALAAPAPFAFARGAGTKTIAAAALFSGDGLAFAFDEAPKGVTIDAASGVVTVPTAAALAGAVVVRAANAVGAATQRLAVSVLAVPAALAAPAPFVYDLEAGTKAIAAAALFSGDALVFALDEAPKGVTIDAASGVVTVPTAAALAGAVAVRAANAVGAATQRLAVEVRAAIGRPVTLGQPNALVFLQGTGAQTVSAQAFFAGEGLAYAIVAAPAGVSINPGSGLVSMPTEAAYPAAPVTVRASNAAGAVTQTVTVTVRATRTVFDSAAALGDVRFLFETAAPAWTFNAGGFARLTSGANDRAHGDWNLAAGDGRYRALARWSAGVASPKQSRPFGLIGRMTKTGADFRGVRVDAVLPSGGGARALQIRDYTGATVATTTIGQTPVAWVWDAWWWLEAEFDGATVRARLYPETAAAPDWQVTATTTALAPGAFGPTSHVVVDGQTPVADIRRLEFLPLAAAAPAAAAAGDWALGQTTVKP